VYAVYATHARKAQLLWRRTPRDVDGHESEGVGRADVGATVDGLFDTIYIAVFDCLEKAELRRICACTPAPQAKRRRAPAILASLRLHETRFPTAREQRPRACVSCVRWRQEDHRRHRRSEDGPEHRHSPPFGMEFTHFTPPCAMPDRSHTSPQKSLLLKPKADRLGCGGGS
jgi:hypothetical protein